MNIYKIIALFSIIAFISCGEVEEAEPEKQCNPVEPLIISNSSEYQILRLYVHDTVDYFNDPGTLQITTNMNLTDTLDYTVSYGDQMYFTFVRYITSASTIEIAVTTGSPVYIEDCYKYTLHLLEEDFYLEKSNNYTIVK